MNACLGINNNTLQAETLIFFWLYLLSHDAVHTPVWTIRKGSACWVQQKQSNVLSGKLVYMSNKNNIIVINLSGMYNHDSI